VKHWRFLVQPAAPFVMIPQFVEQPDSGLCLSLAVGGMAVMPAS
jgi:hypothetical protein